MCLRSLAILALLGIGTAPRPLTAQVAAAELTGIVTDRDGAAVPGATVTVTNVATNRRHVGATTAEGVYAASSLAPGQYRLDVTLAGFRSVRREGVRLSTRDRPSIHTKP